MFWAYIYFGYCIISFAYFSSPLYCFFFVCLGLFWALQIAGGFFFCSKISPSTSSSLFSSKMWATLFTYCYFMRKSRKSIYVSECKYIKKKCVHWLHCVSVQAPAINILCIYHTWVQNYCRKTIVNFCLPL